MRRSRLADLIVAVAITVFVCTLDLSAQQFVNGLAQPIFNGNASNIITHNVWVEVPDLDVDRDGVNDRIRIQIRRIRETETQGLRLPIVMTASPYSGGQLSFPTHNIN